MLDPSSRGIITAMSETFPGSSAAASVESGARQEVFYPFDVDETPVRTGGDKTRTHRLKAVSEDVLIAEPTRRAIWEARAHYLGALAIWAVPVSAIVDAPSDEWAAVIFVVAFFGLVGWVLWEYGSRYMSYLKTFRFDRRERACTVVGKRARLRGARGNRRIRFEDIAGIQLLGELVETSEDHDDYKSFELNLVLSEPQGERVIIMDHAHWGQLMGEAEKLSKLMDRPIYNATISSRARPELNRGS